MHKVYLGGEKWEIHLQDQTIVLSESDMNGIFTDCVPREQYESALQDIGALESDIEDLQEEIDDLRCS